MSDYLSSFIIEPVRRQARRISRISTGEDSATLYLPTVPESLRTWYPTRLWNTSPPPSIGEDGDEASTSQPLADHRQWATQMPSPPWEPMDSPARDQDPPERSRNASVTEFPDLEPGIAQQSTPPHLAALRAYSDHSINPSRHLADRSRILEDEGGGHAHSDPIAAARARLSAAPSPQSSLSAGPLTESTSSRSRESSGLLPEDDGNRAMRQKIATISAGSGSAQEKAKLIHRLMMERYRLAQVNATARPATLPHSSGGQIITASMLLGTEAQDGERTSRRSIEYNAVYYNLKQKDLQPSYAPPEPAEGEEEEPLRDSAQLHLGCQHYRRNVKLQCYTCKRWYTCRLCHDEVEDHLLPRRETKNMLCMVCNTPQDAGQTCKMCGNEAACYYCDVCKLWNNDPEKSIYHCDDCGICRLGQGLGKDFFHCKTCVVCMSIAAEATHRCIEQSTKCDCPICGQYLFTSAKSVVFMRCGHAIHEECFKALCKSSYKCPMCSKSVTNMESQFRNLDRNIADQPMPEEYRGTRAYVYCNDCTSKTTTAFHWLGLKCALCESYNTTMLEQIVPTNHRPQDHPATNNVTASPPLPTNITDAAVAIPRSRATSRRQSTAISDIDTTTGSPWLQPQQRSARSVSPVVGNYFGLDRREGLESPSALARFWGRRRPRDESAMEDGSEDESSSDEEMEDIEDEDDDVEDDPMDLLGHR